MKKSLQEALERARKQSLDFPQHTVRVMDKKGERTCVHLSDWVCQEKLLDGWQISAVFQNGKQIAP